MDKRFQLAICQNKPDRDKRTSVEHAISMVEKAADDGAELIALPEIFYHPYEMKSIPKLEEKSRETVHELAKLAKKRSIYICAGSTAQREGEKRFNKSFLIDSEGKIVLEHGKCHLFDVNFKDLRVQESKTFDAGDTLDVVETDLGVIGLLVCYDIRFPEAARALTLKGAELIIVPAAFNTVTGPAHWHVMFRARAIENQVFVAAASPARDANALYQAYGHSMIIDPWGEIIAEADENESIISADIDPEKQVDVRGRLPLLKHRRPELYR